ncbi:MAG: hypothetical protein ABFC96_17935 [Thermoguttaceae bacterium]
MTHIHGRILSIGVATLGLLLPAGSLALAGGAATPPGTKPAAASAAKTAPATPRRQLRPEQVELRDRVRAVLAAQREQPFNTRDNSATEILSRCLAFGCSTDVFIGGPEGQKLNGITCLCWNYPCAGFELLGRSRNYVAARIGYGYQERPAEFLAALAFSRVQPDYPVRLGRNVRKVGDLVAVEKLACRSGSDLSFALIGLSYYVESPSWKNELGETWSIERIVEEELSQPVVGAPEGGMNRLLGLSHALARRTRSGRPIDGEFERAQKYVADFQRFAFHQQAADGSWGPDFLARRTGNSSDAAEQLRSNGRILEWLAVSLPERRLEEPAMVNAVSYVTNLIGSERYQSNTPMLSTREIVSLGHALHALTIYDAREFQPADDPQKPATEKPADEKPADGQGDA